MDKCSAANNMTASKKERRPKSRQNSHTIYHTLYASVNIPTDIFGDSPLCTVFPKLSYSLFRLAQKGARCYHKGRNRDESKHPECVSSILKKARLTKDGTQDLWEMTRAAVIRGLITSCGGSFLIFSRSNRPCGSPPAPGSSAPAAPGHRRPPRSGGSAPWPRRSPPG